MVGMDHNNTDNRTIRVHGKEEPATNSHARTPLPTIKLEYKGDVGDTKHQSPKSRVVTGIVTGGGKPLVRRMKETVLTDTLTGEQQGDEV